MKKYLVSQTSAKPSHYNKEAKYYDAFNEDDSTLINKTIERILKKNNVKTVLDLTCGTGSQVFYLTKRGYQIIGLDINAHMLKIAKQRAKEEKLPLTFMQGDMRTTKVGQFDAVISIFNAIGHLTKSDFDKAIKNIAHNLKKGGLYIFDIFNLDYLLKDNHITQLTIDWQRIIGPTQIRTIQYSTINKAGILTSYTTLHEQKISQKPKISRTAQTLQVYTAKKLKKMLHKNGFKFIQQTGIDGSKFKEEKTDRILIVAKKY